MTVPVVILAQQWHSGLVLHFIIYSVSLLWWEYDIIFNNAKLFSRICCYWMIFLIEKSPAFYKYCTEFGDLARYITITVHFPHNQNKHTANVLKIMYYAMNMNTTICLCGNLYVECLWGSNQCGLLEQQVISKLQNLIGCFCSLRHIDENCFW